MARFPAAFGSEKLKKDRVLLRTLEAFTRVVSRLSSATASQLGFFLLGEQMREGRTTWTVTELASELSWSRNTVAAARDHLVEQGLLHLPGSKKWELAVERSECTQKDMSSSSSFHDPEDSDEEWAEQLVSRLVQEGEFAESLARTVVLQCPRAAIEKTLDNLEDWRAFNSHRPEPEQVRSWSAYLFCCIQRGGLGKLGRAALAVIQGELPALVKKPESKPARRPEPSRAPVPDVGGSRVKPGAAREEIAAVNASREAENLRLQTEYEQIWPLLEPAQREQIVDQVRQQLPPIFARQPQFEEGPVFQALVRAKTVEVHRSNGLPWRPVSTTRERATWSGQRSPHELTRTKASSSENGTCLRRTGV